MTGNFLYSAAQIGLRSTQPKWPSAGNSGLRLLSGVAHAPEHGQELTPILVRPSLLTLRESIYTHSFGISGIPFSIETVSILVIADDES